MNFRDPIYDYVEIDPEFEDFILNPYFLRLHNIKQNSLLYAIYPSAKHDRFCHCVGAYHLMKQAVQNKYMNISNEDQYLLKAAALLHDVGHGPYSHLWEHMVKGFDHEEISCEIIKKIFKQPKVAKVLEKKHKNYQLISSVIDVDKLDYMMRDSYFSGVGYGKTDVDRIVNNVFFEGEKLCILPKVVATAEHLLMGRNILYRSTYFHRKVRALDMNLINIFKRARDIYKDTDLFVDPLLLKCFENKLTLNDFLHTTDVLIEYHLNQWESTKDPILKDLIKRFSSMRGFNAVSRYWISIDPKLAEKKIAKKFDIKYYYKRDTINKPVYENEIYVKNFENKIVPLSKFSEIVGMISNFNIKEDFVIGPSEIIKKNKGI